jgi:hypothetical protein
MKLVIMIFALLLLILSSNAMTSGELRLEIIKNRINGGSPNWNSWDVFSSNLASNDSEIIKDSINKRGICAPTIPPTPIQTPNQTPPCYVKPPTTPPEKPPHLGVDAWYGQFWYTEVYLPKWPRVF